MNNRLAQFIQAENISQAQFADSIGVARASVSHILAGRNRPGFDFIESMSRRYPSLNLEWLITGRGKMYKNREDPPVEAPTMAISNDSTAPVTPIQEPSADTVTPKLDLPKANSLDKLSKTTGHQRNITRIVIFFDDNTFQELK